MLTRLRDRLIALSRRQKIAIMLAADALALPTSLFAAFYLRLGDSNALQPYGVTAPLIMALATIPVFYLCGLYRNVVRFIDLSMLRSTGFGLAALAIGTYFTCAMLGEIKPPRTSLFIYWFIAFTYVIISRFGARRLLRTRFARGPAAPRVAIYGAGEAGFQLATAMRSGGMATPACFFDDDNRLANRHVAGLRVYPMSKLLEIVQSGAIQEIVLAIPSAAPERRRAILNRLVDIGLPVKTMPPLIEMVEGKVDAAAVREIQVEDLLGRKPVPPMKELFAKCVAGKSVMVTGAGGSIGSELCRQLLSQAPSELVLIDHSEFALYAIEHEIRERFPGIKVTPYLGSICDESLVKRALVNHGVQTIYHAAAYKHVPLVEANIAEGIRNNVFGSWSVASAAEACGVETCVLISTDKAVRPPNAMGATKRCAELIFQAFSSKPDCKTVFSMVRFGNVLGSSGSVVPLFRNQIKRGGPITVTDPEVTRFFMLIPEAAQLVIQAAAMADGGEVFVLDMGEPVRIIDLARTMIEMSGLSERCAANPEGDIEIAISGLRSGEKLYEELLISGRVATSTHPRILRCEEYHLVMAELVKRMDILAQRCDDGDTIFIRAALQDIVAEYAPYSSYATQNSTLPRAIMHIEQEHLTSPKRRTSPKADPRHELVTRSASCS